MILDGKAFARSYCSFLCSAPSAFVAGALSLVLASSFGISHASPLPPDKPLSHHNLVVFMRDEINPKTGDVVIGGKLWVMEADGSNLRQVTFGNTYDDHPSLYPDGKSVLFTRFPVNNRLEYRRIYKDSRPYWIRKDGTGPVLMDSDRLPLERAADAPLVRLDLATGMQSIVLQLPGCQLHHANISPVGGRISYQADCTGESQRFIDLPPGGWPIAAIATNGVALPDGAIFQSEPDKSKSARKRDVQIVRMRGSGGAATFEVLASGKRNRRPVPSPLLDFFSWQANVDGAEDEIWVARMDGSEPRNITNSAGNDGHPWFSSDGRTIFFESDRTGEWEIWKIDLAGGRQTQLTFGQGKYSSTRARPVANPDRQPNPDRPQTIPNIR